MNELPDHVSDGPSTVRHRHLVSLDDPDESTDEIRAGLTTCAALSRVAEAATRRYVAYAAAAGMTQQDIATAREVSQATVSRLLRGTEAIGRERRPIEEVLDLYVAGLITDEVFVDAAMSCDLTFGYLAKTGEGEWVPGDWDRIDRARHRGLIPPSVFSDLAREVEARYPGEHIW